MGWHTRCCGGEDPVLPCILCDTGTTPRTVQVTIPAIGNGTCDCSNLAGTYILTQRAVGTCFYDGTFDIDMGACGTVSYKLTAYYFDFLGEQRNCLLQKGSSVSNRANWNFNGSEVNPWDCSADQTLLIETYGPGTDCNWAGITGSVTWESLY